MNDDEMIFFFKQKSCLSFYSVETNLKSKNNENREIIFSADFSNFHGNIGNGYRKPENEHLDGW